MEKKAKNKQSDKKNKTTKKEDCHYNNLFESSPKNLEYFEDLSILNEWKIRISFFYMKMKFY